MLALQALCAFDAVGADFGDRLNVFLRDEQVLADLEIEVPPPGEIVSFARQLALGAWGQRKTIDGRLSRTASHWSVTRMTPVDRNVLRLGAHELLEHPETPPEVVIDQAIELARQFGDTDSPAFVNGVLDAVRRAIEAEAGPVPGDSPETDNSKAGGED